MKAVGSSALRSVNSSSESDARGAKLGLMSYAQGGGATVMSDLREAAEKCKKYEMQDESAYNADMILVNLPSDGDVLKIPTTVVAVRVAGGCQTALRAWEPSVI